MHRRTLLLAASAGIARASAQGGPAPALKIGNTMPYSGPASAYGAIGRGLAAYFRMVNERGGIAGRQIDFISLDDGYSPPRTVEQTRRLVEQDQVDFILNGLGTPTQSAVQRYMNQKKVPQLFVSSGADKWADPARFPWTIGFQPSYRTEAQIYAKYILANRPGGKVAVLWQDDDFGKDYLAGLKAGLGAAYDRMVVKTASYEVSDPTIDSQAVELQASGADVLVSAATPKFAAQMIRKVDDLGWKPLHFMSAVAISTASVIEPAGKTRARGLLAAAYMKDDADPQWRDDAGMGEWRAFMRAYMPGADLADSNYPYAYAVGATTMRVLQRCGGDFARETVMHQATNLPEFQPPTLLPGCVVATSPDNWHAVRHMQMMLWNGERWERFGGVIDSAAM